VDLTKIPVLKFLIQQKDKILLQKKCHIFRTLEMELQIIDYVHLTINLDQQKDKEFSIQETTVISLVKMKKKVM